MKTPGVYFLLCVVLIQLSQAKEKWDWEKAPEWSFQVLLGSDIELSCNDTENMVMEGDILQWKNPHGDVIMMNSDKYTLTKNNNVNHIHLKVMDVQNGDSGVYMCNIMRNNMHHMKVNRAINLKDPLYSNLLSKYEYNIMIGGIAAAALFVPLVVMCCIYKYRYMTSEEKEFEKNAKNMRKMTHTQDVEAGPLPAKHSPRNGGQYNPGFSESTNL